MTLPKFMRDRIISDLAPEPPAAPPIEGRLRQLDRATGRGHKPTRFSRAVDALTSPAGRSLLEADEAAPETPAGIGLLNLWFRPSPEAPWEHVADGKDLAELRAAKKAAGERGQVGEWRVTYALDDEHGQRSVTL